jgi:hypothetical protein
MGFMVRQIPAGANLSEEQGLDALATALPPAAVRAAVDAVGVREQRQRKLPAELTVLLVVAMSLFAREARERVLDKLRGGLRLRWPDPTCHQATKSAIGQARARVGARARVALFHQVCRPLATPTTPGAFCFGLRMLALDATTEAVPDTPANPRAFGSQHNQHGRANFPQVLACYLVECGTHAVLDAGFWPIYAGEAPCARRLLRSVGAGMLLTWDAGLHSYALLQQTLATGAHVLSRVPGSVRRPPHQHLADGTVVALLRPGHIPPGTSPSPIPVRVLSYTIPDPARPGAGQRHRLLTTLLDPVTAPALDVICA